MGAHASAYAALGLEPGADRAAVEQAYKRLIKSHHPDRSGGDARRAAEITQAYRELRDEGAVREGLVVYDHAGRRRRGHWPALAAGLGLVSLALLISAGWEPAVEHFVTRTAQRVARGKPAAPRRDPMQGPLASAEIAGAVADARSISRSGDEMALSRASFACQDRLRGAPTIGLLDRCAAFDDAVVMLQDRDPLRDGGPFGELSVTTRQWAAAKALSDDVVAIDSRLGQVRLQVELALAPPPLPPQRQASQEPQDYQEPEESHQAQHVKQRQQPQQGEQEQAQQADQPPGD